MSWIVFRPRHVRSRMYTKSPIASVDSVTVTSCLSFRLAAAIRCCFEQVRAPHVTDFGVFSPSPHNQLLMATSYSQGEHRLVTMVLLRIEGNEEKILCLRVVSSCMPGLIPVEVQASDGSVQVPNYAKVHASWN